MNNKLGKKVLHGVVMFSMVLSLAPVFSGYNVAQAAVATTACSEAGKPGNFLKVEGKPAIFGISASGESRFWGEGYMAKSWFKEYKDMGYKYVTQDCINSLPLPKMAPFSMNIAPGVQVVKYDEFDQLYVVEPGNAVAPVSVDVAKALYGTNYVVQKVGLRDWPNLATCKKAEFKDKLPHPGQVIKVGSMYYWVNYGKMIHEITTNGMNANHKMMQNVRVWPESVMASFTKGDKVDGYLAMAGDVHQQGWSCDQDPWMGKWTQPSSTPPSTTTTIPGTTLNVTGESVAPQQLSDGTAYNKLLKLNFTSSGSDVRVKGLTITKLGVSQNSLITGISVWDAKGHRYGDVLSSINSNNQVTVGFGSDPLVVAKGYTESLYVAFNVSSTMNSGQLGAGINAAGDVMTDAAQVSGTFPMNSSVATIFDGSSQLATFTVTAQSPGGNSSSGADGNVQVGDVKEIAKFKFTNNSTNNNALSVSNLTFYIEGTVKDKDFTKFTLLAPDNTPLGTADYASNRYVTIQLEKPYMIPQSQNRTLTLKANVENGSGNWIRAHIQNDYDMVVKDEATTYNVLPSAFSDQTASDGYFKVRSGTINLAKSADSPAGNISAGANDVVLARFDVTAVGEDMEVRKMGIQVTTSGPAYPLTGNITIRSLGANGQPDQTLLNFSASDDGNLYNNGSQRNLSSYLNLKAGQTTKVEVLGSINSAVTSTSYTVRVGQLYAKRLSTLDFADNMPTTSPSSTAGNTLTVQSTNLTLTKDTSLGNKNVGTSGDFIVGQYVVRAGNAESVRLTNLSLKFAGTASAPDHLQNLELWVGDSVSPSGTLVNAMKLGTTINSPATSSNSFSFDLPIAKNTNKVLQVKTYVLSSANAGNTIVTQVDSFTYVGTSTQNATTDSTNDPLGQTMTIAAANVIISNTNDNTTASSIRLPSDTAVQLGKWKVESQNEGVDFNRITLWVTRPSGHVNTSSQEFGTLYLYDANNQAEGKELASANYVGGQGNGYAQFVKNNMLSVSKDEIKYLVLKGTVNHSGTMNPATTSAWSWYSSEVEALSTGTTYLDVRSLSGSQLSGAAIDFGAAGNSPAAINKATSTFYLYHNAAPVITVQNANTDNSATYQLSAQAPLFKFIISNPGDRELRMASTTVRLAVSGMASSSAAYIDGFKLYEANNTGAPGTLLATGASTDCITAAAFGGCTQAGTIDILWNIAKQNNGQLTNFTVPAGGSRTIIMTGDTTRSLTGRASGAGPVTISASISGNTGVSLGDSTYEPDWSNGNLFYFYTPQGGSENSTAYSASDSYPVNGTALSRS